MHTTHRFSRDQIKILRITRPEVSRVDPHVPYSDKLALVTRVLKSIRRQLRFQLSVLCPALPSQDNNKVTHLARGDEGGSTNKIMYVTLISFKFENGNIVLQKRKFHFIVYLTSVPKFICL